MSGQPAASPEAGSFEFGQAAAVLAERDPVLRRLIAETGADRVAAVRRVASGLAGPRHRLPAAGGRGGGRHPRPPAGRTRRCGHRRRAAVADAGSDARGRPVRRPRPPRCTIWPARCWTARSCSSPAQLWDENDDEVVARLSTVRGIGKWTSEMFLIFQLRRLDVWPTGDLGVRKGYGLAWGIPTPTAKQLDPLGDPYRPYRTVLTWYCWRAAERYAGAADSARSPAEPGQPAGSVPRAGPARPGTLCSPRAASAAICSANSGQSSRGKSCPIPFERPLSRCAGHSGLPLAGAAGSAATSGSRPPVDDQRRHPDLGSVSPAPVAGCVDGRL